MDRDTRLKRLKFRSEHRGTKEADLLVGGFFARHGGTWNDAQLHWFEAFLEEQDADIVSWAMGATDVPERLKGPMIDAFKRLDFVA